MSEKFSEFITKHRLPVSSTGKARYCWVDLETTGLDSDRDVILEVGLILSDNEGYVIEDGIWHGLIWEHSDHYNDRLANMDDFVRQMHDASGLRLALNEAIEQGKHYSLARAQTMMLEFLQAHNVEKGQLFMAGSSVHFDVGFLEHYMHGFIDYQNYRQVNVSTLKTLCNELSPELYEKIMAYTTPAKIHRSLSDLADSLHEFYVYRDNFLYLPEG